LEVVIDIHFNKLLKIDVFLFNFLHAVKVFQTNP